MSQMTTDILNALPKWMFSVAFFVFVVLMIISFFAKEPFSIAGYEFGFSPKSRELKNRNLVYTVRGTIEKADEKLPIDIMINPRYPPLYPSSEGNIFGLEVWRNPADGKLPLLSFSHSDYGVEAVDLNDADKVREEKQGDFNTIRIIEKISLKPINRDNQ